MEPSVEPAKPAEPEIPRLRSRVITGRPNVQPTANTAADSPSDGADRSNSGTGSLNEERKDAPISSSQGVTSKAPRPDSNSFCPRSGSTSSITSVGSGGGNRASLLEAAAASTTLQASYSQPPTLMRLH